MRTYSPFIRNFLVCCIFSSLGAEAALLREWPLPAGSQPLQIDASSPTGNAYFVDQALMTINQLNPGGSSLVSWPAPFTPSTPGSIVVEPFAALRFVYVTDLPGTILGQLDISTSTYYQFNLALLPWNISGGPRQLVFDSSHTVEPNDNAVWFTASGDAATGTAPMIGYLAPSTSKFRVWPLPSTIASPGDALDGLAFVVAPDGPAVFFTVNGPAGSGRNEVAKLSPLINIVTAWPLPASYSQPVPIVATRTGDVYRVQCPGCNTMAQIKTGASLLNEWSSPVDTTDMFLALDAGALVPRFTGTFSGVPSADMLIPTCNFVTTPLAPIRAQVSPDIAYLDPDRNPLQPIIQDAPFQVRNLDQTTMCPFIRWLPISSGGPISMDSMGGTWISETAAQFIASFF